MCTHAHTDTTEFSPYLFTCNIVTLNEAAIFQITLLQKESEIPVEELLARYRKVCYGTNSVYNFAGLHQTLISIASFTSFC